MKISFKEFINESKNYPLFKGVDDIDKILKSGVLRDSKNWNSPVRKNVGIDYGISASRFFGTSVNYGMCVLELDTVAISSRYKIIPFAENPDYYLWYSGSDMGAVQSTRSPKDDDYDSDTADDFMRRALKNKKYGKEYWDYKTNTGAMDFQIAEEVILTKELPIKYIKKLYFLEEKKDVKHFDSIKKILNENNIPYEFVDQYNKNLSAIRYKDKKKIKVDSQT